MAALKDIRHSIKQQKHLIELCHKDKLSKLYRNHTRGSKWWKLLSRYLNKDAKSSSNITNVELADPTSKITIPPEERIAYVLKYYNNLYNSKPPPDSFDADFLREMEQKVQQQELLPIDNTNIISFTEVRDSIQSLSNNSSSDVSGICAEMIKYGDESLFRLIHDIVNDCFNTGKIPNDWRLGLLTPIFKQRNKDRTDISNYRGLTSRPILYKIYA